MRSSLSWLLLLPLGTALAKPMQSATANFDELTPQENADIEARLSAFYASPSTPDAMSRYIPKFNAVTGEQRPFKAHLSVTQQPYDPLLRLAQFKATDEYQAYLCSPERARRFGRDMCPKTTRASIERNDRVDDLVDGWLDTPIVRTLSEMPVAAAVETLPWSDDYWRTRWGGLSYRYSSERAYATYEEAVRAYEQPKEWLALAGAPVKRVEKTIVKWSPAEKYDLSAGDTSYTLTRQQKHEGSQLLERGNVPEWFGLCDGWAAASITTPRPEKPVDVLGPNGIQVHWTPVDVRALTTLAWARGNFGGNFIGGRCDAKKPHTHPNGRIVNQDCFDNNPATFHLVLGNMISKVGQPFLIDSSFDAEVWNLPVLAYSTQYFNPNDRDRRSEDWQSVAVDYDDTFKKHDRFQKPLTRGRRHGRKYDDRRVRKIVGAITTITIGAQYEPVSGDEVIPDETSRMTYIYDLELSEVGGKLVPTGGEWHDNAHPDFMWVPSRNAVVSLSGMSAEYDPTKVPSPELTATAVQASRESLPLCSILRSLIRISSNQPTAAVCAD